MELGSPLEHVRETVNLLRQWWEPNQTASSDGEITVRHWRREFSPLGAPPIYLAATGRKMQALAGQIADGLRLNTLGSVPFLKRSVETFLEAATSVNHDPADLRIFANPGLTITANDDQIEPALERKKTSIALLHALPGMDQQLEGLEAEFDIEAILARVRKHMRTEEILPAAAASPTCGERATSKRPGKRFRLSWSIAWPWSARRSECCRDSRSTPTLGSPTSSRYRASFRTTSCATRSSRCNCRQATENPFGSPRVMGDATSPSMIRMGKAAAGTSGMMSPDERSPLGVPISPSVLRGCCTVPGDRE